MPRLLGKISRCKTSQSLLRKPDSASKPSSKKAINWLRLDQANAYWFDHKAVEVDSLLTLSNQLKQLESRQDCLVIRGQLIAGRASQSIRRTLKASAGEEPNFEHCSQQWCLIDIDDLPLPEHLSDYQNNKTEIVGFCRLSSTRAVP